MTCERNISRVKTGMDVCRLLPQKKTGQHLLHLDGPPSPETQPKVIHLDVFLSQFAQSRWVSLMFLTILIFVFHNWNMLDL